MEKESKSVEKFFHENIKSIMGAILIIILLLVFNSAVREFILPVIKKEISTKDYIDQVILPIIKEEVSTKDYIDKVILPVIKEEVSTKDYIYEVISPEIEKKLEKYLRPEIETGSFVTGEGEEEVAKNHKIPIKYLKLLEDGQYIAKEDFKSFEKYNELNNKLEKNLAEWEQIKQSNNGKLDEKIKKLLSETIMIRNELSEEHEVMRAKTEGSLDIKFYWGSKVSDKNHIVLNIDNTAIKDLIESGEIYTIFYGDKYIEFPIILRSLNSKYEDKKSAIGLMPKGVFKQIFIDSKLGQKNGTVSLKKL